MGDSINKRLWAKKGVGNESLKWLPLKQHLWDTGQVSGLLYEHWLSDGQKRLVEDLFEKENQGKRLVILIGMLHDIGKATPAFQTKKSYIQNDDLDIELLSRLAQSSFDGITELDLQVGKVTPHGLAGECILTWHGAKEGLAAVIGSHHGRPIDDLALVKSQENYKINYYQSEKEDSEIARKWKNQHEAIISWTLETVGWSCLADIPDIPQPVQVLLSGLVIMADWIASNERYFPLLPIDEDQVADLDARLENGWNAWQQTDTWHQESMNSSEKGFESRFGFLPHLLQSKCADVINATKDPGLLIIEAPMGCGKTEAALFSAELMAKKTGRSGLFFGLPTQATSNGVFLRVKNWLEKIVTSEDEQYSLRLSHGKAALNDDFRSLAQDIYHEDEAIDGAVVVNEWFAGKKTALLDDFVVGTVDHFLLLALRQKHFSLRHLGFSKKVVIIDEVHAYDAYMNQYLLRAIRWMGAYRVPVIVLSATLPRDRRNAIVEAYLLGRGEKTKDIRGNLSKLNEMAYPVITYTDGIEVKQAKEFEAVTDKSVNIVRVADNNLDDKIDDNDLMKKVDELIQHEGIIGIIVNTVKRAQKLAIQLRERYEEKHGTDIVSLLHANFIATDRVSKENALMKDIGKGAIRPKRKIIIGTQVIEQSLDIDFDVLITDLAPMDLLIQRIGRLHRHPIDRPEYYREPTVYVCGTSEALNFDGGAEAVYGEYLLARTQYYLPKQINIPSSIPTLVQQVYQAKEQDKEISFSDDLQEKYEGFFERHKKKIDLKEQKAGTFILNKPKLTHSRRRLNTLVGMLKRDKGDLTEERAFAQVRDIEETIEVIALKKIDAGYGFMEDDIDISNKIGKADISRRVAQATIRLPRELGAWRAENTIAFLEKYNDKHLKNWQDIPWLKGSLGIIFENNQFRIEVEKGGEQEVFILNYCSELGLQWERA